MNKLPVETIISIVSYLSDEQMITASCVCKEWNQIIRNSLLYRTLELDYSNIKNYFASIAFFEENKQYGRKVRTLEATGEKTIPYKEIAQWPCMFPNVIDFKLNFGKQNQQYNDTYLDRLFSSSSDEDFDDTDDDDDDQQQQAPLGPSKNNFFIWKNLETVDECSRFFYTSNILDSGKCKNLGSITIDFEYMVMPAFQELVRLLHQAPALTSLSAYKARIIETNDLEILHEHAPRLKNLHFFTPTVIWRTGDDGITTDISPALSITSIVLSEVNITAIGRNRILKYITSKYPNVESLKMKRWEDDFGVPLSESALTIQPEFEDAIIQLANHCGKIKDYNADIHPYTSAILSAFEEAGTLKLKAYSAMDSLILDLKNIANSKQKHYIEHLDVLVPDTFEADLLSIINQFTNLRSLTFIPSPALGLVENQNFFLDITLDAFLEHHSKLTQLKLCTCRLKFSENFNAEEHTSIIYSLEIVSSVIENPSPTQPNVDLAHYLSRSCPELKLLTLSCNFKQPLVGPPDYYLHFSNQDIQYLSLYFKGYTYICVEDLLGVVDWYSIVKRGSRFLCRRQEEIPKIRRATRSKPESGVIYVKCKNVGSFSLHPGRDPNYVSFFG